MASKSTKKTIMQYLGLGLFSLALVCFTLMLGLDNYKLEEASLTSFISDNLGEEQSVWQLEALKAELSDRGSTAKEYSSTFAFNNELNALFEGTNARVESRIATEGLPADTQAWQLKIPSWLTTNTDQLFGLTQRAAIGPVTSNPLLWLFLTFGLAIIGGLLYIIPQFRQHPGIKNDHIYHSPLTRGLRYGWRALFLAVVSIGILTYGVSYMDDKWFWPVLSASIGVLIFLLAVLADRKMLASPVRTAGPGEWTAWLGVLAGVYFISFYVLLYWVPQHIVAWVQMVDHVSRSISGNPAGRWFLYGLMYTVIVGVMGVRMMAKYRHNKYQLIRTGSVMFFQTAFAFLIPEILVALNQPWFDLKNIWPLDYDFFQQWQVDQLWTAGALGKGMLMWGIALVVVGVPLMVHLVGKRWYCSWVCGCGGLAETMGDPWRQLSDKSVRAWRVERWLIHGVLVFAVIMTLGTIYSYLGTGDYWLTRSSFLLLSMALLAGAMSFSWYLHRTDRVDISPIGMQVALGVTIVMLLMLGSAYLKSADRLFLISDKLLIFIVLIAAAAAWQAYHRGQLQASKLGMRIGLSIAMVLAGFLLWHNYTASDALLNVDNYKVQKWYGFLIGAGFAGVIGTGFYPLMGNRVWCRFGCPLAAYLGLVQRFQSRFRITTNGGQCISCGNCSTHCEMGIDVRAYAQRGQDIVRSSCVGCGVCSAVCPRGVLRLENASGDISERATALRTIHVSEEDIRIMV